MSGQDADEELLQHLDSVLAVPDASEGEGGVVAEVLAHHLFKKDDEEEKQEANNNQLEHPWSFGKKISFDHVIPQFKLIAL